MPSASLAALCSVVPPVDAQVLDPDTVRLLLSDAPDPSIPERRGVVVDCDWSGSGRLIAELSGAQRFVLPTRPSIVRVMTPGGRITSIAGGHATETEVVREEEGPLFLGMLTCLLVTVDALYVGGMSRQLYRGDVSAARWQRVDEGLVDRSFESNSSALYDLAETSSGQLVGVGGDGEIWRRRDGTWDPIESGTNVMLNGVCNVTDRRLVACGAGGVLLTLGEEDDIDFIVQPFGEEFLSAVRAIGRQFFVVAQSGLHRFVVEPRIEYVGPVSERHRVMLLVRGTENLWAIGPQVLGKSTDGTLWEWKESSEFTVAIPA